MSPGTSLPPAPPAPNLEALATALGAYQPDPATHPDDHYAFLVCQEALLAARAGNYGVGCLLTDPAGRVIVRGHNQVFRPSFRSDLHAEMVVLNHFEQTCPELTDLSGYQLVVSLEPCPMCLTRIIMAGIGVMRYVSPDQGGGMIGNLHALPPSFKTLAGGQVFGQARCSAQLRQLALSLFTQNLAELRGRLLQRRPRV